MNKKEKRLAKQILEAEKDLRWELEESAFCTRKILDRVNTLHELLIDLEELVGDE